MAIICLRVIFFGTLIIGNALIVFAQDGGNFKRPPEHVAETVRGGKPYYAGMTKDQLYKVYPVSSQKSYYTEGNEEWILFIDEPTKDDTKNAIAFYLKDGVVSGWRKKDVPITPDERRKIISGRSKISGVSNLGGGNSAGGTTPAPRPIYNPPRYSTDY